MKQVESFIIRRIPLASLYRNTLVLGLSCSRCGHSFAVEYNKSGFQGRLGECPKCSARQHLRPGHLRQTLEKSFRSAARRADAHGTLLSREMLGVAIANAARLLEPVLLVVVVHFWHQIMGHYIATVTAFLRRLKKAGFGEALLFAMPTNPKTESNHYLKEKLGERFIITPAAVPAFHLLEKKPTVIDKLATRWRNWRCNRHVRDYIRLELDHARTLRFNRFDHAIDLLAPIRYQWLLHADLDEEDNWPPFVITGKDDDRAKQWFAKHGVSMEKPFACFLGRDFAYADRLTPGKRPYIHQIRNMNIQDYLPSMQWLAEQGVSPFRVGNIVQERLATDDRRIIDYPFVKPDDFMDIYLTSKCLFYVSCASGLDILSAYMGRWLLFCNYFHMLYVGLRHCPNICYVPRKYWCHTRRRFLSFREIITERRHAIFQNNTSSVTNGVSLVDNTPEEIAAAVREVHARATGTWKTGKEEEAMQSECRRILGEAYPGMEVKNVYSFNYFKMNPWLLD